MNINLNIPLQLLKDLIRSINDLTEAYKTVHREELRLAALEQQPVDKTKYKSYYQSDRRLHEQELKDRENVDKLKLDEET